MSCDPGRFLLPNSSHRQTPPPRPARRQELTFYVEIRTWVEAQDGLSVETWAPNPL